MVVDDPDAEREVQQVRNREQRDHCRQPLLPIRQHGQRQSHIAAVVEHDGGTNVRRSSCRSRANGQASNPEPRHYADAAEDQELAAAEIEFLA
jgi:hypothetical protein